MIERYTLPEMAHIWSDENKFKIWLEIEILACEAQVQLGIAPPEIISEIRSKAKININRINEIEQTTKHDVIAFLTSIEEQVGEPSRFIHLGMTSSDVLDTSLAVQAKQAGELILEGVLALVESGHRLVPPLRPSGCGYAGSTLPAQGLAPGRSCDTCGIGIYAAVTGAAICVLCRYGRPHGTPKEDL